MKKMLIPVMLLSVLLGISSCSGKGENSKVDFESFISSLDGSLPGWMNRYGVPGSAIAIIHDGKIAFEKGYGWANKEKRIPVSNSTVFRIASVSKPFAAWGVMKLVERGILDLDAPAEAYLKSWHLPRSEYDSGEVTIRRLLSHTAGTSVEGTPLYSRDKELPTLAQSLSGAAGDQWRVFIGYKPGAAFHYSSGGYSVLEQVIEDVTGTRFSEYMRKEVFQPLGLTSAGYDIDQYAAGITATGYTGSGKPVIEKQRVQLAGGSLLMTADDLARFTLACIKGLTVQGKENELLVPETLKLMFTPSDNAESIMGKYGLGFVNQVLSNGSTMVSHSGDILGWNAQMAFIPENGEGFVLLTNSDAGYYFKSDVLGEWSQWAAGGINNDTLFARRMQMIFAGATLFLILALFVKVIGNVLKFKRSLLRFNFKTKSKKATTWVKGSAALLAVTLWIFAFYTDVPAKLLFKLDDYLLFTFFTPAFSWLTLSVMLWGLYSAGLSLFVSRVARTKPLPRKES